MNNGTHYVPTSSEAPLLPRYFRDQGYRTLRIGKIFHDSRWMLSGKPLRTTDDPAAWDLSEDEPLADDRDEDGDTKQRSNSAEKLTISFTKLDVADEATGDGIVARRASKLLEQNAAADRPFFLAVGFRKPHISLNAPRKYFDLYKPEQIPVVRESPEHLKSLLPAAVNRYFSESPDDPKARESILAYYACVSFMDAQVGIVLDTLDRLKLRGNTIIVFVSDNGFHLGQHGMWGKNTLFDESTRVPLIIASNRADHKPATCQRVVEFLDIYPTLVELCGLPTPSNLQGHTLLPLLNDPQSPWDHAAYTIVKRGPIMGRSLRTEHFRYSEWDAGKEGTELYDLEKDPRELRNVAADPAYATQKAQLQQQLHKRADITPAQPAKKSTLAAHHPKKSRRLRSRLLWAAGSALALTALGSLYWITRRRRGQGTMA
jgi:uncharacterized sulfatase